MDSGTRRCPPPAAPGRRRLGAWARRPRSWCRRRWPLAREPGSSRRGLWRGARPPSGPADLDAGHSRVV